MIAGVNDLFGFSTTIANIRASALGLGIGQGLCNSFISGFNYQTSYGLTIYQKVKSSNINSTPGFTIGTTYDGIENNIFNFLNEAYPTNGIANNKILALVSNAILFSYYTYNDINIDDVVGLLGQILFYTSANITGNQIFSIDDTGFVATVFNVDNIQTFLLANYADVISSMAQAPKNATAPIVNYNWYNVSNIFPSPNLQLMKDVENQYYYISGQLIYSSGDINLPNCVSKTINITTTGGVIQSTYIVNQPCIDQSSYIGPVTGVSFYRVFNDGPYSSGDFNSAIEQQYISFAQDVINSGDYASNSKVLYSFITGSDSGYYPIAYPDIYIDQEGIYNLSQEYINLPDSYECSNVYSIMHMGGNNARIICARDIYDNCLTGECSYVAMTGFKFASLELNPSWQSNFTYLKTNPYTPPSSALKRALNILPQSFISQLNGDSYLAFGQNNLMCLGYPQFTGQTAIPNLAFFQNFDSPTFGVLPSVSFYASIGTSNNGGGDLSDRTYEISTIPLFSGTANSVPITDTTGASVKFNVSISSNYGNSGDSIIKQFFGMGDSFNGQNSILGAPSYNAGYIYTGYLISGSGVLENLTLFNQQISGSILGSPVKNIKFISGYTNNEGNQYLISQIYAQDNTGNLISYYYLDNRNLPEDLQVQENQLYSFGQLPSNFETNPLYNRVTGVQQLENYLPRYSAGAFSSQNTTFLYPNAQIADSIYNSKQNGFPLRINFTLNIREEAIRELYALFYIGRDGSISNTPSYINVIRVNSNGGLDGVTGITPLMTTIFQPNNSYFNTQYDFNNFAIGGDFEYSVYGFNAVDNNWAPYIQRNTNVDSKGNVTYTYQQTNNIFGTQYAYTPSGRNTATFGDTNTFLNNITPFQGEKLTGRICNSPYQIYYGTGVNDYYQQYYEMPINNGLYHYYSTYQISGYLLYTPPIFDLGSGSIYVNDAIQEAFQLTIYPTSNQGFYEPCNQFGDFGQCQTVSSGYILQMNGITGRIHDGYEPISLEYIGGRSGGFLVEQEGGYNSQGIIGDQWNQFSFLKYGMKGPDSYDISYPAQPTRSPQLDSKLVLINAVPNLTKIITRGLNYNPGLITYTPFIPFIGTETYQYQLGNNIGNLSLKFSGDFATFNMRNYMPMKNVSGNNFYDATGLIIGPFDRDMELGVLYNNGLYSNGSIICNENVITDPSGYGYFDNNSVIYSDFMNSGIFTSQLNRSVNYSIFAVIPKNSYAIINVSGINNGLVGFQKITGVSGIDLNFDTISLRPRKMIGASIYNNAIHWGEQGWIDPSYFLKNNWEQSFSIPTNKFEDLNGQFNTFTTYSKSGKMYPVPNQDFTGLANIDKYGNFIFPSTATVENYWRNYAQKNSLNMSITGWREGSRVSFQFSNVQVLYDEMPYQSRNDVIPSGTCTISGEMAYLKQAEASIYSAGIVVTDSTNPISNAIQNASPSFISDVLQRLPDYLEISGELQQPVFDAPSIMIQRVNIDTISGNQSYNKLFNYPPQNYNKTNWSASSDLEYLNAGTTLEATLANDPTAYNTSSLLFSASQGQALPNGSFNPNINKIYYISDIYQFYDGISTDAAINPICTTNIRGTQVQIQQSGMLSGIFAPEGTTILMAQNGLL